MKEKGTGKEFVGDSVGRRGRVRIGLVVRFSSARFDSVRCVTSVPRDTENVVVPHRDNRRVVRLYMSIRIISSEVFQFRTGLRE